MSTAVITTKQLIAYYQKAVNEKWGYVWSLNGELYTRAMAEEYHRIQKKTSEKRDPKTYWIKDCAKWIGKMSADCSGGIVGAMRSVNPSYGDRQANKFFDECTKTGPISTIPEVPGLCVWRNGHIGIYEGNGYVLEFRGTDYGAVRTRLKDRDFTHWGYLRDVNYGEKEEPIVAKKVFVIQQPQVYDKDVLDIQTLFKRLGYDCGPLDGVNGTKTMKGIQEFCMAHLSVDIANLQMVMAINGQEYRFELKGNG